MVKLGIIIPTYNYGAYLRKAIESALMCGDFVEVLVVDDGSTDDTQALVKQWQAEGLNFSYVYQENAGPAVARNKGIEKLESEFFMFLDADDQLCTENIKSVLDALAADPNAGLIIAPHNSIDGEQVKLVSPGRITLSREENFSNYLINKKLRMSNGAMIIRANALSSLRFPERFRSGEDIPFFASLLANNNALEADYPLVSVVKHSDSLRHNVQHAKDGGEGLVDAVFRGVAMPDWALKYENEYRARHCLSLFRTLFLAGMKKESLVFYKQALKISPKKALKFNYIKKALRAMMS